LQRVSTTLIERWDINKFTLGSSRGIHNYGGSAFDRIGRRAAWGKSDEIFADARDEACRRDLPDAAIAPARHDGEQGRRLETVNGYRGRIAAPPVQLSSRYLIVAPGLKHSYDLKNEKGG
jgi:hypothetical protein